MGGLIPTPAATRSRPERGRRAARVAAGATGLAAAGWLALRLVAPPSPASAPPPSPAQAAPLPAATPGDPDRQARELLGDGFYLESGMGDYRGAAERYRQASALAGLDLELRAEVLFHLGHALEKLGDRAGAAEAYREVVEQHAAATRWSEPARIRLSRIREAEASIRRLPVTLDFERDAGGWLHSSHYAAKGGLHRAVDPGIARTGAAALEWRTTVAAREDDLIYLPLEPGEAVLREVRFSVRTTAFPARLFLFVVQVDGSRFSSPGFVVSPADGWVTQQFRLDEDFRPIAGQGSASGPDPTRIKFLMLQDATGFFSTDRGENRILLDDFTLR